MSTKSSNISSYSNNKSNTASIASFTAKLRRLKIEEAILLQSINKSAPTGFPSDNISATSNLSSLEFNKFFTDTKNSYKKLKHLFEDIKASTSCKEVIKAIDIDEIKKSTHELENNIKSFKLHLQTEVTKLKSIERQLNQQLIDPVSINNLKRKPRVQAAKYTEIIPSPVKTLMSSPFKCTEVQEFQEFMKNSKNRYGGWNEYHHNIFVNLWQKHFDSIDPSFSVVDKYEGSEEFYIFLRELLPKLLGLSNEDVISHIKWYTKYIILKDRQQKAIDKWRSNRKKMQHSNVEAETENVPNIKLKSRREKRDNRDAINKIEYLNAKDDMILYKETERRTVRTCSKIKDCYADIKSNDAQTTLQFLKSTKQWDSKCSSSEVITKTKIYDLENIKKLGTPTWRIGL